MFTSLWPCLNLIVLLCVVPLQRLIKSRGFTLEAHAIMLDYRPRGDTSPQCLKRSLQFKVLYCVTYWLILHFSSLPKAFVHTPAFQ